MQERPWRLEHGKSWTPELLERIQDAGFSGQGSGGRMLTAEFPCPSKIAFEAAQGTVDKQDAYLPADC